MKRIDNRTVELTDREMVCKDTFEGHLVAGYSITGAALLALNEYGIKDPTFVEYLSDGTCEVVCRKVRVKAEHRTPTAKPAPTVDDMRQRLGMA